VFDVFHQQHVSSGPMRLSRYHRIIAGTALAAFLLAISLPVIAVARMVFDPVGFATVCRVDLGGGSSAPASGDSHGKLKAAHCVMCLGSASPPPTAGLAMRVVARIPELSVIDHHGLPAIHNLSALQPLNPRAPPRA